MNLRMLMGSGEKIMLSTLPFLVTGLVLNILFPSIFSVGGPPIVLKVISLVLLVVGIIIWGWSAVLILTKAPKKELVTYGPYSMVKHPLYTSVAFLVLPWIGMLFDTWLGIFIGIVLYISSRIFSPKEEEMMARTFGRRWEEYCEKVKLPWI